MWLFIAIIKNETAFAKILSIMLEMELTDAAVVDGEDIENFAARTFPLFSAVTELFSERLRYNRVLLCKLPDRTVAADLARLCREDGIDPTDPETGSFMMIPCEKWI